MSFDRNAREMLTARLEDLLYQMEPEEQAEWQREILEMFVSSNLLPATLYNAVRRHQGPGQFAQDLIETNEGLHEHLNLMPDRLDRAMRAPTIENWLYAIV